MRIDIKFIFNDLVIFIYRKGQVLKLIDRIRTGIGAYNLFKSLYFLRIHRPAAFEFLTRLHPEARLLIIFNRLRLCTICFDHNIFPVFHIFRYLRICFIPAVVLPVNIQDLLRVIHHQAECCIVRSHKSEVHTVLFQWILNGSYFF